MQTLKSRCADILRFAGVFLLFSWITAQTLMRFQIIPELQKWSLIAAAVDLKFPEQNIKENVSLTTCAPTLHLFTRRDPAAEKVEMK